ncbi:ornithine carbamoyltransferase [Candidatus Marsarchaeota archaeon]|nr:ornithine carbamoyltransferase [Candidatus Marsarchaeota archaeon]
MDDFSKEQINEIFDIADDLKKGRLAISLKERSVLALLFQKPSTRTRTSFEVAIVKLGGAAIYIDPSTSQISRGESIGDTAKVLSAYVDFLAARMFSQNDLLELARNSSIPVINALTDTEHPTQALADLYTILQAKKKLKRVRIAFVGDIAANTANSLMLAGAKLGAEISLVGPNGYPPNPVYFTKAREFSRVEAHDEIKEGVADADIIYTDTFVSMGQEKEAEKRKAFFSKYQVNSSMLNYAKKDVLVMHCLPAHRGEEITAEVIDGPKSIVWEQAKNKLLLEQAIILYLSEKKF